MNLEESNSFMQEEIKRSKKKKTVITFIVICSLLIVVLFFLILVIQYQDSQTLKMFINGKQVGISSTLYKQINNTTYINIKEIGEMIGYQYTQGEYNKYNEDENSCYLSNDFEVVALTAEEKIFTKYAQQLQQDATIAELPVTVKSPEGQSQKYNLNNNIKLVDGSIYVPFESLPDILNVQLNLANEKRIRIYTLEQIIVNTKAVLAETNYTAISGDYENLKAMVYGLAVVGDGTKYGVISLSNANEIIGLKYEDITFIPNLQDFLIKAGNTVGILAADGSTVIKPTEYDEISVYDEDNQLYLVKKDDKYGILNRLGKVIIYPDYDQIGYNISKDNKSSENERKIIFDKCIPVKEGTKYGLYSIEGNELLASVYDQLGSSVSTESSSNEKPVLEIPPELGIKGIVISQNGMYGVYDVSTEAIIIPCVCTKVYSITRTAKTTYYVEYNEEQINLDDYLELHNLKNISVESETQVEGNTVDEETENTNTTTEDTVETATNVAETSSEQPTSTETTPVEQ